MYTGLLQYTFKNHKSSFYILIDKVQIKIQHLEMVSVFPILSKLRNLTNCFILKVDFKKGITIFFNIDFIDNFHFSFFFILLKTSKD